MYCLFNIQWSIFINTIKSCFHISQSLLQILGTCSSSSSHWWGRNGGLCSKCLLNFYTLDHAIIRRSWLLVLTGSSESANSRLKRVGTDATSNLGWSLASAISSKHIFVFHTWSVYLAVLNSIGKGTLHLTNEFVLTRVQISLLIVILLLLLTSTSDTGAKPLNFSSAGEPSDFLVWIVDFGPFLREISIECGERSIQVLLVVLLLHTYETSSHSTNHCTQPSFHGYALGGFKSGVTSNSVSEWACGTYNILVAGSLLELSHLATEWLHL